jgi:hypothetical protein
LYMKLKFDRLSTTFDKSNFLCGFAYVHASEDRE